MKLNDLMYEFYDSRVNPTHRTPSQIVKTVSDPGVPEAIASSGTYFRTATILGKKGARTDNSGVVYIGVTSGDGTQPFDINPGEAVELNASPGEKYDLGDWYVDVEVAGDGVVVIYS